MPTSRAACRRSFTRRRRAPQAPGPSLPLKTRRPDGRRARASRTPRLSRMNDSDRDQPGAERRRGIRSYVLRQGRMSVAQKRAYDQLLAQYAIAFSPQSLDMDRAFGRHAPTVLEIGFGMGETTAAIAQAHPENNYLGVEVHSPGVGSLLKL